MYFNFPSDIICGPARSYTPSVVQNTHLQCLPKTYESLSSQNRTVALYH